MTHIPTDGEIIAEIRSTKTEDTPEGLAVAIRLVAERLGLPHEQVSDVWFLYELGMG